MLVRARDFYYQEAAITWLFSSPEERFYIAYHLAGILRSASDQWLGFIKLSFLVSRKKVCGSLYKGIYFPLDLIVDMVNCELEHRMVAREREEYLHFHGSVGLAARDKSLVRQFQKDMKRVEDASEMANSPWDVLFDGVGPKDGLWN